MVGKTLGHYEVLEKLGEGGMGVVYKARDTHLDRFVALKLLPKGFIDGEERRKRFIQEAKAASALNHPNIVTIYDIDRHDDLDFIAMEYIEGKTLDRLIGKSGLRFTEALNFAEQIAAGVSAAHANRIIHRDLKPSNIVISENGNAKVLDFGLAKIVDPPSSEATAVAAKTNVAPMTEDGVILGTAAYMSPEQAEGQKVDSRSDIFSFGTILYEMLTGQRPFRGNSNASTIAGILREEPKPVTAIASGLPHELDRIVARCLHKNPARRFQHLADLKVELEELRDEAQSGKQPAIPPKPSPARSNWPWIALAACGFLAAGAATWYAQRPAPRRAEYTYRQLTYDSGLTTTPALSRDGKLVAYASDRASGSNLDLFVQQVSGGKPVRLTEHPSDDFNPTFSPDGTQIAFQSSRDGGGIYLVSALGGDARLVARNGVSPDFSPDGKTIAYQVGAFLRESSIYVVPAGGGHPQKLKTGIPHAEKPVWSFDGKFILFAGAKEGRLIDDWFIVPSEGGTAVAVGMPARFGGSVPSQWLADGSILRRPLSFSLTGSSQRLQIVSLDRNHKFVSAESIASGVGAIRGVSADPRAERFVTAEVSSGLQIWSVPIDANSGRIKGPISAVTSGPGTQSYPTISGDNRILAYNSRKSGTPDIYLRVLGSGVEWALTSSPAGTGRGHLSPDGSKVAYARTPGAMVSLFVMSTTGGVEEKVCDACVNTVLGWTPDSRQVITGIGRPIELVLIDIQTGKAASLLRHPSYDLHRGQFSPDGQWLAFNPKTNTQSSIRITPFRGGAAGPEKDWISITDGTGDDASPTWSPDGNLLYFITGRAGFQDLWAQRLDPTIKKAVGAPFEIMAFHTARRVLNSSYGKAVARDKLYWAMEEVVGNIWVADREKSDR